VPDNIKYHNVTCVGSWATPPLLFFQVEVNETAYMSNMVRIVGLFTTTMLQSLRKPNDEDRYVQRMEFIE
jgi:hypothetical protein